MATPYQTDMFRFTRLADATRQPDVLADAAVATIGTVSVTRPGTVAGSAVFYAYSVQMKSRNAQVSLTGTGTANLFSGETLISTAQGNPALGVNETVVLTFPVGTMADSVRIYKGTLNAGTALHLFAEFDFHHNAGGSTVGGTFGGTSYYTGTINGTGGTQIAWQDAQPGVINGTSGTSQGVNRAENNCIFGLALPKYMPKPFTKDQVPKTLASGGRGAYLKGFVFSASFDWTSFGTSDESDAMTISSWPALRFYPYNDTKPTKFYDCYVEDEDRALLGQYFSAAKRSAFKIQGMDALGTSDLLF